MRVSSYHKGTKAPVDEAPHSRYNGAVAGRWRNGRRRGLKILCPQGRVGSNPTRLIIRGVNQQIERIEQIERMEQIEGMSPNPAPLIRSVTLFKTIWR